MNESETDCQVRNYQGDGRSGRKTGGQGLSATVLQVGMPTDPVRVRGFRPADLDSVMVVERRSFRGDAYPRDLFLDYSRSGALFLVAPATGEVAAYVLVSISRTGAELVSIAVHPSARRSGLAKALLMSVLRRLCRAGVTRLSLMVRTGNRAALRFYASFGFRRIRLVRGYYDRGGDGILMAREV